MVERREAHAATPGSAASAVNRITCRLLEAIDALPDGDREGFEPVRVQGMTHELAAELRTPTTASRRSGTTRPSWRAWRDR